ncbi:Predicted integral membrane protein [Seinonella peptonophila]|uniref:Predicted integral membrane protein n=1 Tax=Seinonella peptonophila TaxID=112248 RepID=A0A1M4YCS5_9BACL|nr:DUF2269 family protein [Seinonella peptonophila]SHF03540.1 Predicted integral membrane protein [Seinonella peptonophila]
MDIRIALFIHVFSVATWFGCITMMAMFLRDASRSAELATMNQAIQKTQRWNVTMIIPTSVLALITGIYMLVKGGAGEKALWMLVKERFGSLVVIAFILLILFYGRRLVKALQGENITAEAGKKILGKYIMVLNITVLCMLILIFFVTMKF